MVAIAMRILLVIAGIGVGPRVSEWDCARASVPSLVGTFLVLSLLGTAVVTGLAAVVRGGRARAAPWMPPSWRARPLFGEPLQFFHAMGWYFLAAAASATIVALRGTEPCLQGAVMAGGLGVGLLAGCHMFVHLSPRNFRTQPAADATRRAREDR